MRAINRNRFGSGPELLPKLEASMVPDKPVLTVHDVREFESRKGDRPGPFLSIVFSEFPEHAYSTNATQEDALLALVDAGKLPNDFDKWPGKLIPFYKKENVFKENGVEVRAMKLYAIDPEDYDAAIAQYHANAASSKPAPATTAAPQATGRRSAR